MKIFRNFVKSISEILINWGSRLGDEDLRPERPVYAQVEWKSGRTRAKMLDHVADGGASLTRENSTRFTLRMGGLIVRISSARQINGTVEEFDTGKKIIDNL